LGRRVKLRLRITPYKIIFLKEVEGGIYPSDWFTEEELYAMGMSH
jgi:hypothetical protein